MAVSVLNLPVCIDIASVAALHEQLVACLRSGAPTELNGSAVRRADAAGLQVLIAFLADARAAGVRADLVEPSEALREAARLLGLAGLLDFTPQPTERGS